MILKDMLKSGLDESTSALNACLIELGRRLDIQNHLNDEIWRITSKKGHGEHMSYQELNKLELLDCFVKGNTFMITDMRRDTTYNGFYKTNEI